MTKFKAYLKSEKKQDISKSKSIKKIAELQKEVTSVIIIL